MLQSYYVDSTRMVFTDDREMSLYRTESSRSNENTIEKDCSLNYSFVILSIFVLDILKSMKTKLKIWHSVIFYNRVGRALAAHAEDFVSNPVSANNVFVEVNVGDSRVYLVFTLL